MSINPFTLKELRQLTRSRMISGALFFFLFASVIATYLIPLNGISYNTGRGVVIYLGGSLTLLLGIVLPINIFVRMMKERRGKTAADLTLVTPLPPASIIDGKLRSAYALMFLFSAASLPFCVAAYLLHGITFVEMLKVLALVIGYACVTVHVTIAIASLAASPAMRVILVVIYAFIAVQTSMFGGFVVEMSAEISWWDFVFVLCVMATVCLYLRAYAVAWISPRTTNRDLSIRVVSLLAASGWFAYVLINRGGGDFDHYYKALKAVSFVVMGVFTMMAVRAVMAEPGYSVRQLAARPKSPFLRFWNWLFESGTVNGLFFAIAACVTFLLILPCLRTCLDIGRMAQGVSSHAGEYPYIDDHFWSLSIFLYGVAMLMLVRSLWYRLRGRFRIPLGLVPIAAGVLFAWIQTMPAAMELSGFPLARMFRNLAIGSYEKSVDSIPISAMLFVLGLLSMLPEAINAFKNPGKR